MKDVKKRKGVRVEKRTLADGTIKTYIYAPGDVKPDHAKTVAGSVAQWQRSLQWSKLSASTRTGYATYIKHLIDALGNDPIALVKKGNIFAIRDDIAEDNGHGAAAVFCVAVGRFFKWAVDCEKIASNPALNLKEDLDKGTLPTWTMEQALFAEANLPTHLARTIMLARYTAQRRGDLCKMRWADYDGKSIHVQQEKKGRNKEPTILQIPVRGEFKRVLDSWKAESNSLYILVNAHGQPFNKKLLTTSLYETLPKIGLPVGLSIHGVRKLAAVTLAEAGCTTHEIAAITGHKTLAMVQLYTEKANQVILSDAAITKVEDLNEYRRKKAEGL